MTPSVGQAGSGTWRLSRELELSKIAARTDNSDRGEAEQAPRPAFLSHGQGGRKPQALRLMTMSN
jgi:hypothetical protein